MHLGRLLYSDGLCCARCGCHTETNVLSNFVHDLACWGWGAAFFNLRCRITGKHLT